MTISAREAGDPGSFKEGGGGDACPSVGGEGGWKSFLEWVKLSGNIETSQADLKTYVAGEGRSRETAVTLEIRLLSGI